MRTSRWLLATALATLLVTPFACSDDAGNNSDIQCDDGRDNDGDGSKDYPADPSCDSALDLTEDGLVSPQCKDETDNDGDGKTDYPNDPGCFAPQQDSEDDDCPSGAACPQCSNGKDDDMNGSTDFPSDSGGCTAASDTEEYTSNPNACGAGIMLDKVPFTGMKSGILMAGAASHLTGACGGSGAEHVYEVRVTVPKVIVATTNNDGTMADTVIYMRSSMCTDATAELACNDNVDTIEKSSTLTTSLLPGTYYLVVDSKDAVGGAYDLTVNFFIGEGTVCFGPGDCGPGLICRVPKGETDKECSEHVCEDTIDEDGDGKIGFPTDPGCDSPTDDDETDTCFPTATAGCPECGDGIDNDNDTKIDYGNNGDVTCTSASSGSESCVSTDGVSTLTVATLMDTSAASVNDVRVSCASTGTHSAGDRTYRLDLPAMSNLTINNTNSFDAAVAIYDSTCGGTPIICDDEPENLTTGPLAAGAYYYVVDGYSTGTGAYTLTISGQIAPGQSCTSPLATAGAITCSLGYACQSGTCQPAVCFDGIDNDMPVDMKIDFPFDVGCDSPADTSETNPGTLPQCADTIDNDADTLIDYPADFGCASAASNVEAFCTTETDLTSIAKITAKVTTGTTLAKANDHAPACASSTAPDVTFGLTLPVPVATLQIDTIGSAYDTILLIKSLDCATVLGCDDEGGASNNSSKVVLNGVNPGGLAIVVDGWLSNSGTFKLNVFGTVAPGTRCDSPLFTGGANAVLACPSGTTCTGTNPYPKCQ